MRAQLEALRNENRELKMQTVSGIYEYIYLHIYINIYIYIYTTS